jgi:hypothetical protein
MLSPCGSYGAGQSKEVSNIQYPVDVVSLLANIHLFTLHTMTRAKGNEPAVPAHEEEREMLRPRKSALSRERVVTINKKKGGEMNDGVEAVAPKVKIADKASLKCLVRARMGEHPKVFLAKGRNIQAPWSYTLVGNLRALCPLINKF